MRYLGFLIHLLSFHLLVLACNGQKKATESSMDAKNYEVTELDGSEGQVGNERPVGNEGQVENAEQDSVVLFGAKGYSINTSVSERNGSMADSSGNTVFEHEDSKGEATLMGQEAGIEMSQEALTKITSDPYSGAEQAETLIIDNSKNLRKFYAQVNRTRKPGLPVPEIDFSVETIVVRCSGKTQDGAMPSLHIKRETEDTIVLGVEETPGENAALAATTPFSVYRLRTSGREIVVEE